MDLELYLFLLIFIECVCHKLGTNFTAGPCNPDTGECPCYPHVIGPECDQCEDNYWKIASGNGCEPCNCDPLGSKDLQCNRYTGKCECKENFGGRECNECRENYWGDPKQDQCTRCQCDRDGSESAQCDRKTGACKCRYGIGGHNCDVCARGFIGTAPHCTACGECFDNWDRTLQESEGVTLAEISRAKDIKKVGATGAYTKEFDEIQDQLDDIENLLDKTATIDLGSVEQNFENLRKKMKDLEDGELKELNELLANAGNRNKVAEVTLDKLKEEIEKLKNKTDELRLNGTKLQERNVQGALEIIRNARTQAENALNKAIATQNIVKNIDRRCLATENLLNLTKEAQNKKHEEELATLNNLTGQINALNEQLPELNTMICDGKIFPCDPICGGALCGTCGGITCNDGAKDLAEQAKNLAEQTEMIIKKRGSDVNEYIRNITAVNATHTKGLAEEALEKSLEANINAKNVSQKVNETLEAINEFLKQNDTVIEEMKKIIDETLGKDIQLQPEEIIDLAEKIKTTADSLTNIEPIIEETRGNLEMVQQLKQEAENAKKQVDEIKTTVDSVKKALNKSVEVQKEADEKIVSINQDFNDLNKTLDITDQISSDTHNQIEDTTKKLTILDDELKELQKLLQSNRFVANTLKNQSYTINNKTEETRDKLKTLQQNYENAQKTLDDCLDKADKSQNRANGLSNRAEKLRAIVMTTQRNIEKLKQSTPNNTLDSLEEELQTLIRKMDGYIDKIEKRAEHYKQCT